MRYLGGKSRIAKQLAAVIDEARAPGQYVWDPFCGGLATAAALSARGPVAASDVRESLVALYKAVKAGWAPPAEVSRETYAGARGLPDSDPLKAFCGFGCSFGGKWFGGYADGKRGDGAATAARVLLRDVPKIEQFECLDFLAIEPHATGAVLYLDPPYRGTTGYGMSFDHALFDARVRAWAARNIVFVSEYALPYGECVWQAQLTKNVAGGAGGGRIAVERLYRVRTP